MIIPEAQVKEQQFGNSVDLKKKRETSFVLGLEENQKKGIYIQGYCN